MPARTRRLVDPVVLTTGGATVYTVPVNRIVIVRSVMVVNVSSSVSWVTLGINGLAGSKAVLWQVSLRAGQHFRDETWWVLEAEDTLQAKSATADALTLVVSGAELVP